LQSGLVAIPEHLIGKYWTGIKINERITSQSQGHISTKT
jgi:hypothetical protein